MDDPAATIGSSLDIPVRPTQRASRPDRINLERHPPSSDIRNLLNEEEPC